MAYCESCGSELTDGVKFCKHCGARVGNIDGDAKGISAAEFFDEAPEPDAPEFISAEEFFSEGSKNEGNGMVSAEEFFREGGDNEENDMVSAEEFFSGEDDDMSESIEDGEIDDWKGLDPNRSYHMQIEGRSAILYNDWGQQIRRYNMRTNVIQATTTGELVTICTDDGYTHIYKWDGTFMRRFH